MLVSVSFISVNFDCGKFNFNVANSLLQIRNQELDSCTEAWLVDPTTWIGINIDNYDKS